MYSKIFANQYPDTDFVPYGGTNQVRADGKLSSALLKRLAPGIETWIVFDRDDRSVEEIRELNSEGIKVLPLRDLESYLWRDEVLTALAIKHGQAEKSKILIAEKLRLLSGLPEENPRDDIKAISGRLYNFCKSELSLTQCGNDAEAFAIATLATLVTPETKTYQDLEVAVFGKTTK